MRQSFYLILLQFTSILLGGFTTFYVAYKLPASLYALLGIQVVINSIILVFSNSGLETVGLRNFLFWKSINKSKQIVIITTQSIFVRFSIALFLGLILIFYAAYISNAKFQGNYFYLFLLFISSGIFVAINDSFALLLKAHNKFLQAIFSMYFVSVFGKIIALFVFIYFGLNYYLYTIILLPIIIFFYLLILTIPNISIKYLFSINLLLQSLKNSKHFAFSSYFSYLFNNIDQFLVSLFMTTEIIGAFAFSKQILGILNIFISNFFDPLLQNTVSFKGKLTDMAGYIKKILQWRNIALAIGLAGVIIYYFIGSNFIQSVGFSKYPHLFENLFLIFISILILLFYKVNYYLIATYSHPKTYLRLTIVVAIMSLISFSLFVVFITDRFLFGYLILSNIGILIVTKLILKKEGGLKALVSSKSI